MIRVGGLFPPHFFVKYDASAFGEIRGIMVGAVQLLWFGKI